MVLAGLYLVHNSVLCAAAVVVTCRSVMHDVFSLYFVIVCLFGCNGSAADLADAASSA